MQKCKDALLKTHLIKTWVNAIHCNASWNAIPRGCTHGIHKIKSVKGQLYQLCQKSLPLQYHWKYRSKLLLFCTEIVDTSLGCYTDYVILSAVSLSSINFGDCMLAFKKRDSQLLHPVWCQITVCCVRIFTILAC